MTPSPVARAPHIFLSCGEASGDRYGAALVAALRRRRPDLRLTAAGRSRAGGGRRQPSSSRADRSRSWVSARCSARCRGCWRRVAASGATCRAATSICACRWTFPASTCGWRRRRAPRGIPVFYLVAPQLWAVGRLAAAWIAAGGGPSRRHPAVRTGLVRRARDRRGGARAPARGGLSGGRRPALHSDRREARLGAPDAPLTLGLLPGSRRQEVRPPAAGAAGAPPLCLRARLAPRPLRCVVSAAPGLDPESPGGGGAAGSDDFRDAAGRAAAGARSRAGLQRHRLARGGAGRRAARGRVPHLVVQLRGGAPPGAGAAHRAGEPDPGGADFVREHIQAEVTPRR